MTQGKVEHCTLVPSGVSSGTALKSMEPVPVTRSIASACVCVVVSCVKQSLPRRRPLSRVWRVACAGRSWHTVSAFCFTCAMASALSESTSVAGTEHTRRVILIAKTHN